MKQKKKRNEKQAKAVEAKPRPPEDHIIYDSGGPGEGDSSATKQPPPAC